MPQPAPTPPSWRDRMLDLPTLVEAHDRDAPKPWVVEPLIIEGMLAIVAGKGGAGKTWVLHEAADAVARGITKAGLRGAAPLPVLIIDAEMGPWLTTDRFKAQGYSTDIHVFNAGGMDLLNAEHRQLIWDAALEILGPNGGLLCVDSLRAIVPSAKENESDQMGPVVTWLRELCRKTNAAGILVHHAGWREDRTRGSSAIKDQADVVWYMGRGDSDDGTLRVSCRGADLKAPRWGPPPHDLYLRIREGGGLQLADAPVDRTAEDRRRILQVIRETPAPVAMADVYEAMTGARTENKTVRAHLQALKQAGDIEIVTGRGTAKVVRLVDKLGDAPSL